VKQVEPQGGETWHDDLADLAGKWVADPEFDAVIETMDKPDEELWE
jgi:hypothetical protein